MAGISGRRALLAGWIPALAAGRGATAQTAATPGAAPPDARAAVAQLRFARAMLCARCDNGLERDGVNRPARRSMIGADKLAAARDMMAAAPALPGALPARRQLRYAIEALRDMDEALAIEAIDAAIRAIEAEGFAAAGAPPDPRAVMGQLRLAQRFICPGCADGEWQRAARHGAAKELAAARRRRQAGRALGEVVLAERALAAGDDARARAAMAAAIARLRPRQGPAAE